MKYQWFCDEIVEKSSGRLIFESSTEISDDYFSCCLSDLSTHAECSMMLEFSGKNLAMTIFCNEAELNLPAVEIDSTSPLKILSEYLYEQRQRLERQSEY